MASTSLEAGGMELTEEKVTFAADTSNAERFIPRVAVTKSRMGGTGGTSGSSYEKSFRPFEAVDMTRVLDFDDASERPSDTTMRVCEDAGIEGLKFPVRHVTLRGGFLFYFDVEDVDDHASGHFVSYRAPPLGVVPLDKVDVTTPPGGRRVFREHSSTDAKNGYEFVLIHAPDANNNNNDDDENGGGRGETTRPAAFFVAESLAQRERWIKALRGRTAITRETKLRPNASGRRNSVMEAGRPMLEDIGSTAVGRNQRGARPGQRRGNTQEEDMEEDTEDIEVATQEFGVVEFSDDEWISEFFCTNNDFEAGAKIDLLEQWQASIKRGLRGAVLEQYEYFVLASGEMTTMGKEVTALKTLVETQNEVIKEMKEIDFTAAFQEGEVDSLDTDDDDELLDPPHLRAGGRKARRRRVAQPQDDQSDASSLSSDDEDGLVVSVRRRNRGLASDDDNNDVQIEIPSWLDDASEEISAFIKECRYTDATDLLFKARNEIDDVVALVSVISPRG